MPTMGAGDQGPIPQRKPERQLSWPRLAAGTKTIQWPWAEMVNGPPIVFGRREERVIDRPANAICAKFWCQQAR